MTLCATRHVAAALVVLSGALACGPSASRSATTSRRPAGPDWQDALDVAPDVYAVLRPRAFKRDPVFGSLFKTLMRVAQARTEMRGVTMLEALEGCDEIVLAIGRRGPALDATLVLRGVPAGLDVGKMYNAVGEPIVRLVDARSVANEYAWIDGPSLDAAAVFVLPERIWVLAAGDARARARQAFALPRGSGPPRAAPASDPRALASVRFDAATFLRSRRLRESSAAALTQGLRALTLTLMPGTGGVAATLDYEDAENTEAAAAYSVRLVAALAKSRTDLGWLAGANVSRQPRAVHVTVSIPPRLLDDLRNVTGADLSL